MLKLVLGTIIMTTFLTGCGSKKSGFSTEGIETTSNKAGKTTKIAPRFDFESPRGPVDQPIINNPDTLNTEVTDLRGQLSQTEAELARAAQATAEIKKKSAEAQEEARLEGVEEGLATASEETDGLKQILTETDQRARDAEQAREQAQADRATAIREREDSERRALELEAELRKSNNTLLEQATFVNTLELQIKELEGKIESMGETEETSQEEEAATVALEDEIDALKKALLAERAKLTAQLANATPEQIAELDEVAADTAPEERPEEIAKTLDQIMNEIQAAPPGVRDRIARDNAEPVVETATVTEETPEDKTETVVKTLDQVTNEIQATPPGVNDRIARDNAEPAVVVEEVVLKEEPASEPLKEIFIKTEEKKKMILMFSGIDGSMADLQALLEMPNGSLGFEPLVKLNTEKNIFVSECGDNKLSDYSGWLNFSVDKDSGEKKNCTYKAVQKKDDSLVLAPIPTGEDKSFVIEELIDTVNPLIVVFLATMEKSDMENYDPLDPKFSKYLNFINLTNKVMSKTNMNLEDGGCMINVLSKTLVSADFEELSTDRCKIVTTKIQ